MKFFFCRYVQKLNEKIIRFYSKSLTRNFIIITLKNNTSFYKYTFQRDFYFSVYRINVKFYSWCLSKKII